MEVVKMIALVAGEEVFMGECHPARARVLVKKELASWKDGKLLLHVLNVHDKMLANNPEAIYGPLDKGGVSKAELERRLAWFRSFMTTSTKVFAQMARPLPSLEEALRWAGPPVDAEGDSCVEIEVEEVPLSEEDRLFYEDTSEAPDPEVELRDFWMASDVGRYYGVLMSEGSEWDSTLPHHNWPVLDPQLTREQYEVVWARDRERIHLREGREYRESRPQVVAHLMQIQYLRAHPTI